MPRWTRALLLTIAAGLGACAEQVTRALPDDPEVHAWILLTQSGPSGAWIPTSAAIDAPLRALAFDGSTDLYLLGYHQAAASLRLGGAWPSVDTCHPCAWLTPDRTYHSTAGSAGWTLEQNLPSALSRVLVPDFAGRCDPNACPSFSYNDLRLPLGLSDATSCETMGALACVNAAAVPLDASSALVIQEDGAAHRVFADRAEPSCDFSEVLPLDGWSSRQGALWLLGTDDRLYRAELSGLPASGPCAIAEVVEPLPGEPVRRLAVSETNPSQFFALTTSRAFARYDGQRWEILYRFPKTRELPAGEVVWIGPGHAAAVLDTSEVVEWTNGQLLHHTPLTGVGYNINVMTQARNGRFLIAVDGFGVYGSDQLSGPWEALPGTNIFQHSARLMPWGDFVLFSTAHGLDIYHPVNGRCEGSFALTGHGDPRRMASVGDRTCIISETAVYEPQGMVMRVLRAAADACLTP
ncbi:MAG: hypothetical protein U1E65_19610 [Myxococcota bacterium]